MTVLLFVIIGLVVAVQLVNSGLLDVSIFKVFVPQLKFIVFNNLYSWGFKIASTVFKIELHKE